MLSREEREAEAAVEPTPMTVIPREQHAISRKDISENALKVMYRLNKAGYESWLVGGGVRDLLLGKKPKDFDERFELMRLRYVLSKMTLRIRRYSWEPTDFMKEKIEVGKLHLAQSLDHFGLK